MFFAVSNLSPVKTQIFIPAALNSLIVSGTLSCSLSSTTVPPINVKLFSIMSYSLSINFCLFSIFNSSSCNLFTQES